MIHSLCVMGSFRVYANPAIKIPRKGKALLALLAIAALDGDGMSRERLASMLWPDRRSEQARHNLRTCLRTCLKALRAEAVKTLIADFVNCRLDMATDIADFARLEKSLNQDDLETAAELYRGDFLDDFLIISEPFDEWLRKERDLWRLRAMAVLSRLSATATVNADHGASIRAARRMVHIEPWNEEGQRLLIGALHASGQRGEAARQYRSCRQTLKRDLGIDPDPETEELAARLFVVKSIPPPMADETVWAVEPIKPTDEMLLLRALRLDHEALEKVLLRLERIIDTKHVGMKSLEAMRDVIKERLRDEYLAPAPRHRQQSNGEVGAELLA